MYAYAIDDTPDEVSEQFLDIADKTADFLLECDYLPDYLDDTDDLLNRIFYVMFKDKSVGLDKAMAVETLFLEEIKRKSAYVEENFDTSRSAQVIYQAMLSARNEG